MSKTFGRAVATAAIVVLSASVGPGMAGAAERGPHVGHGPWWNHHVPRLTAEQRQCLTTQGLARKLRAARRPAARVAVWRAAFEACGITFPPRRPPGSTTTTTTTTTMPPPIEPN